MRVLSTLKRPSLFGIALIDALDAMRYRRLLRKKKKTDGRPRFQLFVLALRCEGEATQRFSSVLGAERDETFFTKTALPSRTTRIYPPPCPCSEHQPLARGNLEQGGVLPSGL